MPKHQQLLCAALSLLVWVVGIIVAGSAQPPLRIDLSQRVRQGLQLKLGRDLPRELAWIDARNTTLEKRVHGLAYSVSANNDDVLIVRDFSGMPEYGAILAVGLKEKLTWQGMLQTEAQFILWQAVSNYPFCQLMTDPSTGGVAFFASPDAGSGARIRYMVLRTMDHVWDFLSELVHALEIHALTAPLRPNVADCSTPQQLELPRRIKRRLDGPPDPANRGGLTREHVFWKLLSAARADETDVGCLQDLAAFEEPATEDGPNPSPLESERGIVSSDYQHLAHRPTAGGASHFTKGIHITSNDMRAVSSALLLVVLATTSAFVPLNPPCMANVVAFAGEKESADRFSAEDLDARSRAELRYEPVTIADKLDEVAENVGKLRKDVGELLRTELRSDVGELKSKADEAKTMQTGNIVATVATFLVTLSNMYMMMHLPGK
ncbi:hypothetical protein JKP88DRAFT_263350 [Tribonema minus]|uniref:Uncharacterized protein n=1 Tax=Tribonema minus TaxID=303371 RepID=A0A835YWP1_9STRA|nr:hypothetical protein JKP88DRAFT_263350 [Tribonema minus]